MVTTPDQPPSSGSPSPPSVQPISPATISQLIKSGVLPSLPPGAVAAAALPNDLAAAAAAAAAAATAAAAANSANPSSGTAEQLAAAQRLAAAVLSANNGSGNNGGGNNDVDMKPPVLSLPGLPHFTSDLLWRYPNPFLPQPPPSPLESQVRAHLPGGLGHDPRTWSREDVTVFLRYCEREFDLDRIDMDKFQMNGKALCLLNKNDLSERCSGAGDVIHNILQLLIREACGGFPPPSSPLTPRAPGLMTPTSPAFPQSPHHQWPPMLGGAASLAAAAAAAAAGNSSSNGDSGGASAAPTSSTATSSAAAAAAAAAFPSLSHLISQTNSVTLSPSPSVDSHNGGSPRQQPQPQHLSHEHITSIHQLYPTPVSAAAAAAAAVASSSKQLHVPPPLNNGGVIGQSSPSEDSEDSQENRSTPTGSNGCESGGRSRTPPVQSAPRSPKDATPSSSSSGKEDTPELATSGRLLWDFLQQLLNDQQQRYSNYISWKDKETGVFKIVDPAGLAKLWGLQKNHPSMNYDKMSRALRYYYRVNILRKVQGERHCYQFLRNPTELKSIKNISLLRQQMEAQAAAHKMAAQQAAQAAISQHATVVAPESPPDGGTLAAVNFDEPTDLTMEKAQIRERRKERERRQQLFNGDSRGNSPMDDDEQSPRERERHEPRPEFHLRHLLPQVSIKTDY